MRKDIRIDIKPENKWENYKAAKLEKWCDMKSIVCSTLFPGYPFVIMGNENISSDDQCVWWDALTLENADVVLPATHPPLALWSFVVSQQRELVVKISLHLSGRIYCSNKRKVSQGSLISLCWRQRKERLGIFLYYMTKSF